LTFDYQFQTVGKKKHKCYCGSANCRGFLGLSTNSNTASSGLNPTSTLDYIWEDDTESSEEDEQEESEDEEKTDEEDEHEEKLKEKTNSLKNKKPKKLKDSKDYDVGDISNITYFCFIKSQLFYFFFLKR
jgi:hypothetical protein